LCVSIFISAHTKSHTKVFFRHKKTAPKLIEAA
jgi:hypothetical protein